MRKYSIIDFQIGDSVYHLSNRSLKMVIVKINKELNEVTCRWLDKNGISHSQEFLPEELGKSSDLNPRMMSI